MRSTIHGIANGLMINDWWRVSVLKDEHRKTMNYLGDGSPSASHSMTNGLSFSSWRWATWKRISSDGGCFTINGGDCTNKPKKKKHKKNKQLHSFQRQRTVFQLGKHLNLVRFWVWKPNFWPILSLVANILINFNVHNKIWTNMNL